jgi:hypothetical protein
MHIIACELAPREVLLIFGIPYQRTLHAEQIAPAALAHGGAPLLFRSTLSA